MFSLKKLFGKLTAKRVPGLPTPDRNDPAPLSIDELITAWRNIHAAANLPWVLFEHGTCVRLTCPEADVLAQARTLLGEFGPVHPGTSAGDFDVVKPSGVTGRVVTSHHPDIGTYVSLHSSKKSTSLESDAGDLAVGLFGRSLRDRDARELGAIHIEDHRSTTAGSHKRNQMVPPQLLERVVAEVSRHVRASKGYEEESFINPLTPVDSVAAFAMAKMLTEQNAFDVCVSVAPEGHVYGYFFQQFGAIILSVHVDYPPRRCVILDDLEVIRGKRVLILEDDVASGTTLCHVVNALTMYEPQSMNLFLGRRKDSQVLDSIHPAIGKVFLAEEHLDAGRREEYEMLFVSFFETPVFGSARQE